MSTPNIFYPICGDFLHAKSCHTESNCFMKCNSCSKFCDKEEFNIIHKPSKISITDGVRYDFNV